MASRNPTPSPFSMPTQPILQDNDGTFIYRLIQRLQDVFNSTQRMVPQPATEAPKQALDGMIRLSRSPWRPVSGQTTDKWVYYDSAGSVWRYLSTDPTTP